MTWASSSGPRAAACCSCWCVDVVVVAALLLAAVTAAAVAPCEGASWTPGAVEVELPQADTAAATATSAPVR